jgi:hypothetical protein
MTLESRSRPSRIPAIRDRQSDTWLVRRSLLHQEAPPRESLSEHLPPLNDPQ